MWHLGCSQSERHHEKALQDRRGSEHCRKPLSSADSALCGIDHIHVAGQAALQCLRRVRGGCMYGVILSGVPQGEHQMPPKLLRSGPPPLLPAARGVGGLPRSFAIAALLQAIRTAGAQAQRYGEFAPIYIAAGPQASIMASIRNMTGPWGFA